MSTSIAQMRLDWAKGDAKRDANLTVPEGLTRHLDLSYGPYGKFNLLDVYLPEGTDAPLPAIISIHGGGWFYGDKELYSHYCMRLARRGFAVVNFNYRLAPEDPYPAAIQDVCQLLHWVKDHGPEYHIDLQNLFLVGDSAGGQLAFQVCTMLTSQEYRALFAFAPPEGLTIRACGLNCGCYFLPFSRILKPKMMGAIFEAYLPGDYIPYLPQLKTKKYITKDFPPSHIISFANDYLKFMAKPMGRALRKHGVEHEVHICGQKENKDQGHVHHLTCQSKLAAQVNDEQCAFFRAHMV